MPASSAGPGTAGSISGHADVPRSDPSGAGASQGCGHAAHHEAGSCPFCGPEQHRKRDFQGKTRCCGFHFAEGLRAQASSLHPTSQPVLPGGWGGSEGFVWSRRGCQAPALQWALAGTRESSPLAAWATAVKIAQSLVLCLQTQHLLFLPRKPGEMQASEAHQSPCPFFTAMGYHRNP